MAIPAFVIGLKRASSYYEQTIERLKSVGIDATFWEGVDGENLKLNKDESVRNWWSYMYQGQPLNSGTIGCYMAHYRLFKHIYQQGYEKTLIFEDDAVPAHFFTADTLDKLETLSPPSIMALFNFLMW